MLILCDRAQRRGVKEVDFIVLEGEVRKQLRQFAIDTQADLMVMGTPTSGPRKNIFKQEELKQLIREMEERGDIRIIQIPANNTSLG
jgi:nucleotide-binding universal stress UspA family protein